MQRVDENLAYIKEDVSEIKDAVKSLTVWAQKEQQGEFTEAQQSAIRLYISKAFAARAQSSWSRREKRLVMSGLFVSVAAAVGTISAALKAFLG